MNHNHVHYSSVTSGSTAVPRHKRWSRQKRALIV